MTISDNAGGYAVGWFTLSLINAGLAQSKGRSGFFWWFASIFFGPICTLLIVLVEPIKKPVEISFTGPPAQSEKRS